MNRNTKTGLGISLAGILGLAFHVMHLAHTAASIGDDSKSRVTFSPVIIIQTDSAGKKDTMLMKDYLEKQKK